MRAAFECRVKKMQFHSGHGHGARHERGMFKMWREVSAHDLWRSAHSVGDLVRKLVTRGPTTYLHLSRIRPRYGIAPW
jgi:hypothetical protein